MRTCDRHSAASDAATHLRHKWQEIEKKVKEAENGEYQGVSQHLLHAIASHHDHKAQHQATQQRTRYVEADKPQDEDECEENC